MRQVEKAIKILHTVDNVRADSDGGWLGEKEEEKERLGIEKFKDKKLKGLQENLFPCKKNRLNNEHLLLT